MSRSIIIGFSEERGVTKQFTICDGNVADIEQARVFTDAKRKGKYPKTDINGKKCHIVRLEQRFFDDSMTEIAIAVPSLVAS